MQLNVADLHAVVGVYFWPFVRIIGMIMVAPIFSASVVTPRVRILVAVTLTMIVVPLLPPPPATDPLSVRGGLIAVQQLMIGIAMGFALQMVFDALIVAGQATAMSMGLGFATAIDPQRGVNVPVVSQYFMVLATLAFLAINGHLMIIETLARSFQILPVGEIGIGDGGFRRLAYWGSQMFAGAVTIALPAMTALLIVNLAFGVISRAAPTLNLFAVGFPITMTLGFVIMMVSVPNIINALIDLLQLAFDNALRILTA